MISAATRTALRRSRSRFFSFAALLAIFVIAPKLHADEPYARSRDYDLQHSKIALKFDVEQKKVIGDVTHTISVLKDDTKSLVFDSVGLTMPSVAIKGEKFEVEIKYEGKTSKGAYFILPDKDYPDRPKQIWTQGESEDT